MRLVDFIIAEDVRTEIGGKHTIVGVLTDHITVQTSKPVQGALPFRMGVLLRFECDAEEARSYVFEFGINWGETRLVFFEGEGTRAVESSLISLPLVANTVPLQGSGSFTFTAKITDSTTNTVLFEGALRPLAVAIITPPSQP